MVMFSDELQNKKMYQKKKKNYINKFSFREIEGDSKRFILCDAIVEEVNSTWKSRKRTRERYFQSFASSRSKELWCHLQI